MRVTSATANCATAKPPGASLLVRYVPIPRAATRAVVFAGCVRAYSLYVCVLRPPLCVPSVTVRRSLRVLLRSDLLVRKRFCGRSRRSVCAEAGRTSGGLLHVVWELTLAEVREETRRRAWLVGGWRDVGCRVCCAPRLWPPVEVHFSSKRTNHSFHTCIDMSTDMTIWVPRYLTQCHCRYDYHRYIDNSPLIDIKQCIFTLDTVDTDYYRNTDTIDTDLCGLLSLTICKFVSRFKNVARMELAPVSKSQHYAFCAPILRLRRVFRMYAYLLRA